MSAALRTTAAQYSCVRGSSSAAPAAAAPRQQQQHRQRRFRRASDPFAPSVVAAAAASKDGDGGAPAKAPAKGQQRAVQYGSDWYAATREAARPSSVREEIARRKAVNDVAYRDRRLNSDAWTGSEYKGSRWNILTLLVGLFLLVPVLGLGFAYQTYGVLWG